jgi:hypothetical protein
VHPEVTLAERDRGLGFAPRVAEFLPDRQRPLKVRERLRIEQPDQREAELVERQRLTEPVAQSAQLLRRLNSGNRVGGSRQAISCRPTDAACRVAATILARSSSYQSSAVSMVANASGG